MFLVVLDVLSCFQIVTLLFLQKVQADDVLPNVSAPNVFCGQFIFLVEEFWQTQLQ
jgi:hypothetical protein